MQIFRIFAWFVSMLAIVASSWVNANAPVAVSFAESIADRMGLTAGTCPPLDITLRSKGVWQICFIHEFRSFDAFRTSWDVAAEWEDVFFPSPDWQDFAELEHASSSGGPTGEGWLRNLSAELMIPNEPTSAYSKIYRMAAEPWGFDGDLVATFQLGSSAQSTASILKLAFAPTSHPSSNVVSPGVNVADVSDGVAIPTPNQAQFFNRPEANFAIEDLKSYWTTEPASGGGSIFVPELRFMVRPTNETPLPFLQLMAVYIESGVDGLQELGDATEFVVTSSNPPLRPGVRKEIWLTSTRGYVDSGISGIRFLTGNAPDMQAEVYFRTYIFDDWIPLGVVDIEKVFQ